MNRLAEALSAAIKEEEAMCADDRREGYSDGMANHYQPKRGATYDHAWWEASGDAERLDRRPPPPSIWQHIRARIARVFV